jgi:hypothetical protein
MAKRATASNGKGKKRGPRALPDTTVAQEQEIQRTLTQQEAWDKHFEGIKAARATLEREQAAAKKVVGAANGTYRGLLKQFKKDGGNIEMAIRVLNDLGRDADEVIKDNLDYARYAAFAKLAIGTQAELFEGTGAQPAVKAEPEAEADREELTPEQRIEFAKTEGHMAGKDGKFATDNPYDDGSPEYLAWSGAYRDSQAALAAKFGPKNGAAHSEAAHA